MTFWLHKYINFFEKNFHKRWGSDGALTNS